MSDIFIHTNRPEDMVEIARGVEEREDYEDPERADFYYWVMYRAEEDVEEYDEEAENFVVVGTRTYYEVWFDDEWSADFESIYEAKQFIHEYERIVPYDDFFYSGSCAWIL
ncbi:MAG: hypothetical protein IJ600_08185 [Lachnospiraceae bacterium]|nr:hypothetical protein [Lachnospiraceae bacterium]